MALDKAQLITDLIAVSEQLFNNSSTMTPSDARQSWANGLSDAIDKFVRSGDGVYQAGRLQAGSTPVTPNGSPAIKIQ